MSQDKKRSAPSGSSADDRSGKKRKRSKKVPADEGEIHVVPASFSDISELALGLVLEKLDSAGRFSVRCCCRRTAALARKTYGSYQRVRYRDAVAHGLPFFRWLLGPVSTAVALTVTMEPATVRKLFLAALETGDDAVLRVLRECLILRRDPHQKSIFPAMIKAAVRSGRVERIEDSIRRYDVGIDRHPKGVYVAAAESVQPEVHRMVFADLLRNHPHEVGRAYPKNSIRPPESTISIFASMWKCFVLDVEADRLHRVWLDCTPWQGIHGEPYEETEALPRWLREFGEFNRIFDPAIDAFLRSVSGKLDPRDMLKYAEALRVGDWMLMMIALQEGNKELAQELLDRGEVLYEPRIFDVVQSGSEETFDWVVQNMKRHPEGDDWRERRFSDYVPYDAHCPKYAGRATVRRLFEYYENLHVPVPRKDCLTKFTEDALRSGDWKMVEHLRSLGAGWPKGAVELAVRSNAPFDFIREMVEDGALDRDPGNVLSATLHMDRPNVAEFLISSKRAELDESLILGDREKVHGFLFDRIACAFPAEFSRQISGNGWYGKLLAERRKRAALAPMVNKLLGEN